VEFINKVKSHGIAICSQNATLVPADKKLYALRDVTGTVDNISLIASSVMSKKLACGADAIVIDLKLGDGAFIKTLADAEKLAGIMIATAERMDKKLVVVISGMEEPLGFAVGNALEVKEAIDTLRGHGPEDLTRLCLELGSHMLMLAGHVTNHEEGILELKALIENGKAFNKFVELVTSQGGDVETVRQTDLLTKSALTHEYKSKSTGFISHLSAMDVGLATVKLGAGREVKESIIDYSAGIILVRKVGDFVQKGDTLAVLHANMSSLFQKAEEFMDLAYTYSETKPHKQPLIFKTMS
ncbi:MAG: thymidine phosphorylase, partial [Saprospiraceae bacterium]|nr:thymidine phosphorylase [Saprospiraceae bacterium]